MQILLSAKIKGVSTTVNSNKVQATSVSTSLLHVQLSHKGPLICAICIQLFTLPLNCQVTLFRIKRVHVTYMPFCRHNGIRIIF